jgi:hypothetical protein
MHADAARVEVLEAAHRHSIRHREEILASSECGCFHCIAIFPPSHITSWIDEPGAPAATAWCPRCVIDSVIASASGFPITVEFLWEMKQHWFGREAVGNTED